MLAMSQLTSPDLARLSTLIRTHPQAFGNDFYRTRRKCFSPLYHSQRLMRAVRCVSTHCKCVSALTDVSAN